MLIYIALAVLVGLLGIATVMAQAVGLLALGGVVRLLRCSGCGHLTVTDLQAKPASCPYCRHEHLAHPLATLHLGRPRALSARTHS